MKDYQIDRIVRLQGTDYDRRRKLTNKDITSIKKEYEKGSSIFVLSKKYNVAYPTIRYHVDNKYKSRINKLRNSYAPSLFDASEQKRSRVAYKRAILANKV